MQLHGVDREGTPPDPPGPIEPRRLLDLARVQDRKQRRVHEQGLRLAHEIGEDLLAQRFQKASELPHPPVKRGRVEPHHSREQIREEPPGVTQEEALAFHTPKLLEERERDDLRVRKPLEGLVVPAFWIKQGVSVVYETEEHGQGFFQVGERGGMLGSGHPRFLSSRVRMAPLYRQSMQHTSNGSGAGETGGKLVPQVMCGGS